LRTRRSIVALGLAAVTAAGLLAGCSGAAAPSSSPTESNIHLRFILWVPQDSPQIKAFQSIAKDFEKVYPAVTDVSFETTTVPQLTALLTTQLASSNPPDMSWLPVEDSTQFISAGALLDVAPTLKATKGYDYNDLTPRLQSRWQKGDALYGVPFSTGPMVMFYNKDVWNKAGVPDPSTLMSQGKWTWSEFASIAKTIKDKTGDLAYDPNGYALDWTRLLPLLDAYGAAPWNDSATKCTADQAPMVKAMTLFHDMVFTDKSATQPGQTTNFFSGSIGAATLFLSSSSNLAGVPYGWGMVRTPDGPKGTVQAMGQSSIVAYAAGKHPAASKAFLAFLTNPENGKKLAQYFPPTRKSLLNPETIVGTSTILTPELVKPIVDSSLKNGQLFPVAKDAANVANALNQALTQDVYTPDVPDMKAALTKVCDAIQPYLK